MKKTNVIIIGNGESCLNKEHGELINSFECVVRMNNFKTDGFEKYIGDKTNVWCHSANDDVSPRDLTKIEHMLVFNNYGRWKREWFVDNKTTYASFNCYGVLETLGFYNREFNPSLGFQLTLFYIKLCGKVTCIGFDGLKTGHYFDTNWKHWSGHNGDFESSVFDSLINRNIICQLD